jgi:hypothetical protein
MEIIFREKNCKNLRKPKTNTKANICDIANKNPKKTIT